MAKKSQSTGAEKASQSDFMAAELAANREKQIERLVATQNELLKKLQEANENWFERLKSEVNLASDFTTKLAAARSVPETATAFQEWTSRRTEMAAEDAKRLLGDGQKFMETGARFWSKNWLSNGAGAGSS